MRQGCNADGVPYELHVEMDQEDRYATPAGDDGMTRQEFADECNINVLLAKYETTGTLSHFNNGVPQYLDLGDGVPDLARSLELVAAAGEAFMRLPAVTRREFDNDPVKFVEFAENPANLGKMREWGLAPPEKAPDPPMRVEVVNPVPPPPPSGAGS